MTDYPHKQGVLLLSDVRPLVYLASVGQLDLLIGERMVILPDIIIYKATEDLRWSYAPEIGAWLEKATASYVTRPREQPLPHDVAIKQTDYGEMHAAGRLFNPLRMTGMAGWSGLGGWLYDFFEASSENVLILDERDSTYLSAKEEGTKATLSWMTTLDFLRDGARRGRLQGADKVWENILWHRQKRNLDADLELR